MKKLLSIILMLCITAAVFSFTGCDEKTENGGSNEEASVYSADESLTGEHYKITINDDNTYSYEIYGKKNKVILSDTGMTTAPHIEELPGGIVKFTVQYTESSGTKLTKYCRIEDGSISEDFVSVYGEIGEKVVRPHFYGQKHYVVVDSMFDRSTSAKYYEITDAATDKIYDGIKDIKISDDKTQLTVTYLKAQTYEEATTVIEVK